ncbi:hypothetical protein GCM10023085_17800 [Actinomadura viridis]
MPNGPEAPKQIEEITARTRPVVLVRAAWSMFVSSVFPRPFRFRSILAQHSLHREGRAGPEVLRRCRIDAGRKAMND